MIPNNNGFEHDNKVFYHVFKDLSIAQLLRKSGINKSYGISAYNIFKVLFLLAFHQKIYTNYCSLKEKMILTLKTHTIDLWQITHLIGENSHCF